MIELSERKLIYDLSSSCKEPIVEVGSFLGHPLYVFAKDFLNIIFIRIYIAMILI